MGCQQKFSIYAEELTPQEAIELIKEADKKIGLELPENWQKSVFKRKRFEIKGDGDSVNVEVSKNFSSKGKVWASIRFDGYGSYSIYRLLCEIKKKFRERFKGKTFSVAWLNTEELEEVDCGLTS